MPFVILSYVLQIEILMSELNDIWREVHRGPPDPFLVGTKMLYVLIQCLIYTLGLMVVLVPVELLVHSITLAIDTVCAVLLCIIRHLNKTKSYKGIN